MAEAMKHVEVLAGEIGPRPATTEAEKRAANYIQAVFSARGLESEVQEFASPRTYGWAYVIYHVLTVGSAVIAGLWGGMAVWAAFAFAALSAFFMAMDLETRWGLTKLMPKGPSQNVIARHVPHVRRGERSRKVIIVAHYDSARASLAFAPSMVKGFRTTFGLMKACTFIVPVLILAMALPYTAKAEPYLWYVTMAASAYLLIPLFINVHREFFMKFVDGANDNATGVAAMLATMEAIVQPPDGSVYVTSSIPVTLRTPEAAYEAELVPEGAVLTYSPAGVPGEDAEIEWADEDAGEANEPSRGQRAFEFDTVDFDVIPSSSTSASRSSGAGLQSFDEGDLDEEPLDAGGLDDDAPGGAGLLSRFSRSKDGGKDRKSSRPSKPAADVTDWLAVGEDFDARAAGRKIGSWDNFEEEDGDEGWKGGWAGDDPIDDPEFAASEAARIRRRVTETVDRELSEKEVWFVATGAEEVGTVGMQAFLDVYGDEVRDALIINIDGVGRGSLYWVTAEGMLRTHSADRRLTGLAKRVSRENEILVKPRVYKGLSTDATPAMIRGYKAMSVMAFDSDGRIPGWHWYDDTVENIDPALLDLAVDLIVNMIRSA